MAELYRCNPLGAGLLLRANPSAASAMAQALHNRHIPPVVVPLAQQMQTAHGMLGIRAWSWDPQQLIALDIQAARRQAFARMNLPGPKQDRRHRQHERQRARGRIPGPKGGSQHPNHTNP